MAIKYFYKINIEEMGTPYESDNGVVKSRVGHLWFETFQKDENGNIVDGSEISAGYTPLGIVDSDREKYLTKKSAYSSQEFEISEDNYDTLVKFGTQNSALAIEHGFGKDDYHWATNNCIDFGKKSLELINIDYEKNLIPMHNADNLNIVFGEGTYYDASMEKYISTTNPNLKMETLQEFINEQEDIYLNEDELKEYLESLDSKANISNIEISHKEEDSNFREGAKSILNNMREYLASKGIDIQDKTSNKQELKEESNSSSSNNTENIDTTNSNTTTNNEQEETQENTFVNRQNSIQRNRV